MNPLILLANAEPVVERLPVAQDVQRQFDELLEQQAASFLTAQMTEVAFDGGYSADDDEILLIDKFELPAHILQAVESPLTLNPVDSRQLQQLRIKSIFGGTGGKSPRVLFQAFDQRRLLTRQTFALFHSGNTYTKLDSEVITLDSQLAALFQNGKLYFHSFPLARRVLDLGAYFREATDEDLTQFVAQPRAAFEDEAAFLASADQWTRRKVASIQKDGVLDLKVSDIADAAKALKIPFTVTKKEGRNAIQFPAEKKSLKELLRFLDEDVYSGPLTHRRLVSNSKRQYT